MDATPLRALIAFDQGTRPLAALQRAQWSPQFLPLSQESSKPLDEGVIDLFVLLVDAKTGISKSMIDTWHHFQDRQAPRLLLVQGLEMSSSDFDDIVLIGNRVLENFATPYLVLHREDGSPIGLINILTSEVFDYSTSEPIATVADDELKSLVKDFQDEYLENFSEIGPEGFSGGIYPIALPITRELGIGIRELNLLLATLPKP